MTEFIRKLSKTDTRTILAILSLLGIFSFIGLLFIVRVPKENVALLNTLLPMMITGMGIASYQFYFGSSKKEKEAENEEIK